MIRTTVCQPIVLKFIPVMIFRPEEIWVEAMAMEDETDMAIEIIAMPVIAMPNGFAHFLCLNAYSSGAEGVHSVLC